MSDTIQNVEGYEGVLKDFTDEQLDVVRQQASELMNGDSSLNKICSVLISSRQLYALARYALHREMVAEGHEWSTGVEELLIKAMADRANQAFSRTTLFQNIAGSVKTFMSEELSKEVELSRTEEMLKQQQLYEMRTNRAICGRGLPWLRAGEIVVAVGTPQEINKLAAEIPSIAANFYEEAGEDVVQRAKELGLDVPNILVLSADTATPEHIQGSKVITLGTGKWVGCANTATEFTRLVNTELAKFEPQTLDLILVSDLGLCNTRLKLSEPFTSVPHLCDSIKAIRKTVKALGTTAFLCMPTDQAADTDTLVAQLKKKYEDIEDVLIAPASAYMKEDNGTKPD